MCRLPAATVIALLGIAIALAPVGARADEATTTAPASTTTGLASPTTLTPTTLTPTTLTPTTLTPTTTTRPVAANAHSSTNHVIKVSSNCAYFCFAPIAVTIAPGDTVTWSNTSGAAHTVKRCNPAACEGKSGGTGTDANFGSAEIGLPAGRTFQYTFDQPGTYVYFCTLHGYSLMHGTITVAAAPPTTAPPTTTTFVTIISDPTTPLASSTTASIGPHLASTGGRTNGMLTVALVTLTLGLAAASAGLHRDRAS